MTDPQHVDELFQRAVAAIDAGDRAALESLLAANPRLAAERLEAPGAWLREKVGRAVEPGGFFERPYLLWFVAEDPVRNGSLPMNIADIARVIIDAAQCHGASGLNQQLDYALRLVAWSWIARQCSVQIALIDVLMDAGASADGNPDNALVNGNFAAAAHLVQRGARLSLATALCLERWDDVTHLARAADERMKQFAFVLAALNGKAEALRRMIDIGIDVNRRSEDLYSHGPPLHHAVCSGSLDAVKVLVDAGAKLDTRDSAWDGTPLDWAEHFVREANADRADRQYAAIATYLREAGGPVS